MARTWNRKTEFAGWFSFEDYFALATTVTGLVTKVDPAADEWYDADWNDGAEFSTGNRDEFSSEIEDTELDELKGLRYLRANLPSGELKVAITCYDYVSPMTSLAVSGQDRTVVEGIFVQVSEAIEKRLAAHSDPKPPRKRAVSEEVVPANRTDAQADASIDSTSPQSAAEAKVVAPSTPWWQNTWLVTIIGGAAATAVVALIAGLLR
jgi:hypothetical protein